MRLRGFHLAPVTRPPARPSLWLTLADGDGHEGLGEASPLPPFSRESIDACARALADTCARLTALDDESPAGISLLLQAFPPGVPAARFALETALLDLAARRRGVSLAAFLGGAAPDRPVQVNALLSAEPADTLVARALDLARAGFTCLKIKLRASNRPGFLRELEALTALRAHLPLPFELRLDPNAAWSLDEARARLAALVPIAPAFVEQPVPPGLLPELGPAPVPWAADESLADPAEATLLLDQRTAAAVVLKLPVLGGLLPARDLALRAQERGLGVVVTHFFDGPIGLAAAAELARSLPAPPLACGLDPHPQLSAWPPVSIPQLAHRGAVCASQSPGLGLVLPPPEERPWMA